MIETEHQYQITKAQIAKFQQALEHLLASSEAAKMPPKLRQAHEDALRSELEVLGHQLADYELRFYSAPKRLSDGPRSLRELSTVASPPPIKPVTVSSPSEDAPTT